MQNVRSVRMGVAPAENEDGTLPKVIRTTKFEFYLSIAMIALMIATAVKFYWFPQPGEEIDTPGEWLAVGAFFLFFAGILPGLMIARYLRVSLVWDGDIITQHGILRDDVVDLNRATKVRWHHYRTGGIALTEGNKETCISLWSYDMSPELRLALIRRVYEQVPIANQTNWEVFFKVTVARTLRSVDPTDPIAKRGRALVRLTLALAVLQLVCGGLAVKFVLPQFGRRAAMLTLILPLCILAAMVAWKSKQLRRDAAESFPATLAEWDEYLNRNRSGSDEFDSSPVRP